MRALSLIAAILALCASAGKAEQMDDRTLAERASKDLESAALWLVQNGIAFLAVHNGRALNSKLINDFGVQSWVTPTVDQEQGTAHFSIKSRGIQYEIHELYRETVGHALYEFWIFKVSTTAWSGMDPHMAFLIASAVGPTDIREIVRVSDQFIPSYQTDDGTIVTIPTTDARILYAMQAWLFPEHYVGTGLARTVVVIDPEGNLVSEPLQGD